MSGAEEFDRHGSSIAPSLPPIAETRARVEVST
jgi:hypothetical protein